MTQRFFSDKNRPIHLGPYPLERLKRHAGQVALADVPAFEPLSFNRPDQPASIVNAMRDHQAMLDAICDGLINKTRADCPKDPEERAKHIKSFGYFSDASMVGICALPSDAILDKAHRNPDINRLADEMRGKQTKSMASGIESIMADLRDTLGAPPATIDPHTHAIVFVYEHPRAPTLAEPGTDWIIDAQDHRSCLLAAETAAVIANYLRLLGFDACGHTGTSSHVDLNKLAVAAGLAVVKDDKIVAPFLGTGFGISAITTGFEMTPDAQLVPFADQPDPTRGLSWKLGRGASKGALNHIPFAKRRFVDGPHPFETLKRVDDPTTYIDEARIPRVPKRADMFNRANFGDMGKKLQDGAKGGHYIRKAATSMAQRRALGALALLQDGDSGPEQDQIDPQKAAELVKATSYFLGVDAVGVSRCPEWAWYSHDTAGQPIVPPHAQAISMIVDQGFSTMEGSSGDDWIAVSMSMRAYLRFSLLGGVVARQLRNLGYNAKAHTVMDGEVLQPPLLLLSGLGEVSRIGEVILNPFLGPRLKSGVVTTDMPMAHDKPIDFGLQKFCESCKKCARECPAGAITAGPKLMFNGYETWKSDSQKCATYRITTPGGAMCGRCMKTCPWNLEGVLADKAFRWTAMNIPGSAPLLAKLDDYADRGSLNPIKKWWWDLSINEDGGYRPTTDPVNARSLQKDLDLKHEDQTLAVYPANLAPHPFPYPFPMDREKGIEAYQAMITADEYKARLAYGQVDNLVPALADFGESPVLQVQVTKAKRHADGIVVYDLRSPDSSDLPSWDAGAHLDIVVAPEYLRQYSMCGNPADRSVYQVAVLREENGRGGSALLHRIFTEGRKIFVSKPINHFPLYEDASKSILMGGGIGITPMIAMGHRLHAIGAEFELHYSGRSRKTMALLDDIGGFPWAQNVHLHISDQGSRANMAAIFQDQPLGVHVYTCGAETYMTAVTDAAQAAGIEEDNRHLEYFSVPEAPDYVNHTFTLKLARSGREIIVPAGKSAADTLVEQGVSVDIKCDDGICGVCKCGLVSGDVEHRDFVLSRKQREGEVILCQSRAKNPDGVIEIDL